MLEDAGRLMDLEAQTPKPETTMDLDQVDRKLFLEAVKESDADPEITYRVVRNRLAGYQAGLSLEAYDSVPLNKNLEDPILIETMRQKLKEAEEIEEIIKKDTGAHIEEMLANIRYYRKLAEKRAEEEEKSH